MSPEWWGKGGHVSHPLYGEYEFLMSGNMIMRLPRKMTWNISVVSLNCTLLTVDAGKMSFFFAVVARIYSFFLARNISWRGVSQSQKFIIGTAGAVLGAERRFTATLLHTILCCVICDKGPMLATSHVHTLYNPRRDSFPPPLTYITVLLSPLQYLYTWQDVTSREKHAF